MCVNVGNPVFHIFHIQVTDKLPEIEEKIIHLLTWNLTNDNICSRGLLRREPASPGREPRKTTSEPLLTCYSFEKRLNYSCCGGVCMFYDIAMWVIVMSLGYTVSKLQERVKFLERQMHISPGDPSER